MASYSYSYRGPETTGNRVVAGPDTYSYQYPNACHEDGRIELKLRCPTLTSFRWCLKLYTLVLGALGCFLAFIWVCFHLYVLSQTEVHDLRMLRYLDIGLGLVLFSSMLSLVYAGYSESKAWLVVFTSGSLAVLILYWSWAAYNKYVSTDYSEYSQEMEEVGVVLTIVYFVLLVPVVLFYRAIYQADQHHHHCSNCSRCADPPPVYRSKQGGE